MNKSLLLFGHMALTFALFCSCSDDTSAGPAKPVAPTGSTAVVGAITQTTAECGGSITSDGGADVTGREVCWNTNATPITADNFISDGTGAGDFASSLTGLTAAPSITVTDSDGNVYRTVTIGTQVWMAANLKVTRYRNSDALPSVTDGFAWEALTTGAYRNFDNSPKSAAVYGRLYDWHAVNDSRNIAPERWHVATASDWMTLMSYVGSDPGGKLKDTGTVHWLSPNTGATNQTGFTALLGGSAVIKGHMVLWARSPISGKPQNTTAAEHVFAVCISAMPSLP